MDIGANVNGSIPQDFNPFLAATVATNGLGATSLIYETLLQFNLAAPPAYTPWLATSYKWLDGGSGLAFTIRKGVKFSNGTPMTPADVAYSYKLVAKNAALNGGGVNPKSVTVSGDVVTMKFATPQYAALYQIASVPIVPESIWSKVSDPATYADANPIGTGPYVLQSFSPEGFTLVKRASGYWQAGEPKIDKIYFPAFSSNTGSLTALVGGQSDWSGNFIPGLQKIFVNKDPSTNHFWNAPLSTVSLEPNLNEWPTNQLPVRKAISLAIDRGAINSEAESGYTQPITDSSGLTLPTFKAWESSASGLGAISASANPGAAKTVLEKAGYKLKNGYFNSSSGKEVTLSIVDPSAYTDYAEEDALAATELQAAGIKATFQGQSVDGWGENVSDGNFQLTTHWLNQGITPYAEYDGILDSTLNNGKSSTGDYEGLKDSTVQGELKTLAAAEDTPSQAKALAPLEQYMVANMPVIPTLTEPSWFEYNSSKYTGWPSAADPYELGENTPPTSEVVILHLKPTS